MHVLLLNPEGNQPLSNLFFERSRRIIAISALSIHWQVRWLEMSLYHSSVSLKITISKCWCPDIWELKFVLFYGERSSQLMKCIGHIMLLEKASLPFFWKEGSFKIFSFYNVKCRNLITKFVDFFAKSLHSYC